MMCARYENLKSEVEELDRAGIDSFHLDLMDGLFVPNLGMGLQDIECIRRYTKKPLEAHLMVKNVNAYLEILARCKVDSIIIHPEADLHPFSTLQRIIDYGMKPGVAVDPGTSVESIKELFNIAKRVLVMAVTPGFAGQSFLPFVGKKIKALLELKKEYDFEIIWDGCCKWDKIQTYAPMGVDGFVLGTNILFGQNNTYAEILEKAHCIKK